MKKLLFVCLLGLLSIPAAEARLSSRKKRRIIAAQKAKNLEFQQRFTSFVNVDALPTFPSRGIPGLDTSVNLSTPTLPSIGLPSLGGNNFGLEVPSISLRSPAASLRFNGLSPFGGNTFSSTMPGFNVGMPSFNPSQMLGNVPGLPSIGSISGASGLFGNKKGKHTSTSLPFLDTRDAGDLTYKIEAVKITEAALKELKKTNDSSAGGFQMMGFLVKLLKSVSKRQKGLVGSMLVLISVPYFSTLAASWWMGPTTAMDITWPGAKQGIIAVVEQVLKKYGRMGMGMDIGSFANNLTQAATGQLGSLPGQLGNLGGQLGNLPGQLGNLPGQLGNLPGQLGNLGSGLGNVPGISNLGGQVTNQINGQVSNVTNQIPRFGNFTP